MHPSCLRLIAVVSLAVSTAAVQTDAGSPCYNSGRRYQDYLVVPSVSIPEGVLSPGTVQEVTDKAAWEKLESAPVFRHLRHMKRRRLVLLGPMKYPISCGLHRWVTGVGIDRVAVLHLCKPTTEYPASPGGCAIETMHGKLGLQPYWTNVYWTVGRSAASTD